MLSSISHWNKLGIDIHNAESLASSKSNFPKSIFPISNPIYNRHDSKGFQLLTSLRLRLFHSRDHKLP